MKIKNNKKQKEVITNPYKENQDIIVYDLLEFKFRSIKIDNFTNYLKDKESFKQEIDYLFHTFIPTISKLTFKTIDSHRSQYHYHQIGGEHLTLAKKVLSEYKINKYSDEDLIQLSCGSRGVRLVGERNENIFKIFFIDFHHLIYPNESYNDRNVFSNRFCILNLDP